MVAVALLLVGCSSLGDSEPPPATRATIASPVTRETPDPEGATETGGSLPPETTTPVPVERQYAYRFEDLGAGVDGGWVTVPVDYSNPQGETLELWVTRHRTSSDGRAGVLFTNNGGPGVAASMMARNVNSFFKEPLVERFDVVSWDPRGTGLSGGSVDCINDVEYDRYFGSADITPENEGEREVLVSLAREFAEKCIDSAGDLLSHIGTNNSARDIDAIRQALGEEQASYLGFSYGSELGAVWATLFPDTVRAAVLDGAAHPDSEGTEPVKQQQLGFERVFNSFLAQCSANSSCAFHNDGDAEGAYDRLIATLDEQPAVSSPGRPAANQEVALFAVVQAMYSDARWPALERALADATTGDGAGLLAFHDSYFQRDPNTGIYPNLLESFLAITCADNPDRLSADEADERAEELIGVAPRVFPYTTGSYTCGFFPPSADPRAEITGERAGPIVVIGTTGDPSTPLDSSAAMADALEEGVLVTVEANQHTAYRSGDCINDVVHNYLIWLETPSVGVRCS